MARVRQKKTIYTFDSDTLPARPGRALPEGQRHGVHLQISPAESLDWVLGRLEHWFEDRDDIILVAQGLSRAGSGFIILEWDGIRIDSAFLTVLDEDDIVTDYSLYIRNDEDEDESEDEDIDGEEEDNA